MLEGSSAPSEGQVAVAAGRAEAARADAATANARVKRLAKAVERDAATA